MNRELLEKPFPKNLIQTRKGNFGEEINYIEACHYIKRLNEVFDGAWNFEVLEHKILEEEVIVLGMLTAGGVVKTAFGGSGITRSRENGKPFCIADDIKAAATDSLKKACSLFGLGLYLYMEAPGGDDTASSEDAVARGVARGFSPVHSPAKDGNDGGNGNNGDPQGKANLITRKQLDYLNVIAREKGVNRKALEEMSRNLFNSNPERLSKHEASKLIEHLRNGKKISGKEVKTDAISSGK